MSFYWEFGVSDLDRVFHYVGISITSGEATEDFQFLFTGIKQSQKEGFGPQVLLSDAAEAITNGFLNVFGDTFTRAYCFFHVMKNADDKQNRGIWKEVRDDISTLQLARSSEEFEVAKELWNRKYQKNPSTKDFQKYFHEEHLKRRAVWYERVANCFPSTNNGLESTNRWIKDQGTLRSRLPMALMIQFLSDQSKSWSFEQRPYTPNFKSLAFTPTIGLQIQTEAFNWIRQKQEI
jgi:hypothetical protein